MDRLSHDRTDGEPLRVLVLARSFPNNVFPLLGLWTKRLVECTADLAQVVVVSPVPVAPPSFMQKFTPYFAQFARVAHRDQAGEVEVVHPRLLTGPGHSLYAVEAASYLGAVLPAVRGLRRRFPFHVIHAHFTYPDGVVAVLLGRIFRVPVVVTEHVLWLPWIRQQHAVRLQARWAAREVDALLPVSRAVEADIREVAGPHVKMQRVPNVVDGTVFAPRRGTHKIAGQILFVGAIRFSKGVDLLLDAMRAVRQRRPDARLILAGDPFYRSYQMEVIRLRKLAAELGVEGVIQMIGGRAPEEIAELMAASEVVVLPSRRESFGAVLIEALASGTPVVATRCGGPEDFITPAVGCLVERENPAGLAEAILSVLADPAAYAPETLRRYALNQYGRDAVTRQLAHVYGGVVNAQRFEFPTSSVDAPPMEGSFTTQTRSLAHHGTTLLDQPRTFS